MAKIKPDATGAMLNKAGGFVYYVRNGVNYVRTLSKGEYRSNTPAQELQRAKFGTLSSLSQWFSEVAKVGLKPPKGQTVANAWHSLNKDACLEDGVSVAVDFEALQFSKGVLFPPSVSMSMDGETKTVSVNLQAQPDESNCKTDDKVYAIVVDKEHLFSRVEELGARLKFRHFLGIFPDRHLYHKSCVIQMKGKIFQASRVRNHITIIVVFKFIDTVYIDL